MKVDFPLSRKVQVGCDVSCLHNIKNSTAPNILRLRTHSFHTSLLMSMWLGLIQKLWGNSSRLRTVEPYSSLLSPLRMKSRTHVTTAHVKFILPDPAGLFRG